MFNKIAMFTTALAFAFVSNPVFARDCSLKQIGSLDMTFTPTRGFSVPVELDGTVHPMLVSLSLFSSLTADAVKQLQLPTSDATGDSMIMDNAYVLSKVIVPEISIAGASGWKFPMYVWPASDRSMEGSDGFVGTDLLQNFDIEFDFKDSKLNLFSHDHCEGQVVYWAATAAVLPFRYAQMRTLVFDMELDDMTVHADLNPGVAHGGMFMETAHRLFGLSPDSPGMIVKTRDKDGLPTLYEYQFKKLSLGGVIISNFIEDVYPATKGRGFPCDGRPHNRGGRQQVCWGINDISVGLDELRKLRLFFAFNEKNLYVTAADAHK